MRASVALVVAPQSLAGPVPDSRFDSELVFNPSVLADEECPECGYWSPDVDPFGHHAWCSHVKEAKR